MNNNSWNEEVNNNSWNEEVTNITDQIRVGLLSKLQPGDHIYTYPRGFIYSHHGIYVGGDRVIHFTRTPENYVATGIDVADRIIVSSSALHTSTAPCPGCGMMSEASGVNASCLKCFLDGGELYWYEYGVSPEVILAKAVGGTCTTATSDPVEHVILRAEFLLQNGFGSYHVLQHNCEDFALFCKTGLITSEYPSGQQATPFVGGSGQAASFKAAASAIAYHGADLVGTALGKALSSYLGLRSPQPPGEVLTSAVAEAVMSAREDYHHRRLMSDIGMRSDVRKVSVMELLSSGGNALDPGRAQQMLP